MDLRIFKNILNEASKKDNNTSKTIGYSPKILSDFLRTINSHYEQTKWWDYCYVGPKENSKHNQVFFDTIKYIVENEDIDITQDTRNILNKTLTSILPGLNNDKSMLIELDNKLDIHYPVRIFMENDVYFNIFIKHDVYAIYDYALKTYKNAIKRYNYNLSKKESGVPSKQKNYKQPKLPTFIERLIKSVQFPSKITDNIDNDLKTFSEQFEGCDIEMFKQLFTSEIIDKEFTIDDDIKKYIVYKNTDNKLQTLDNKSEFIDDSSKKSDSILDKSTEIPQKENSSFIYSDNDGIALNENDGVNFNYQGNIATNIIYNTFILCSMDRKKSLSSRNAPYFIYRNVNSKIIGIDNKDYQTITKYLRAAAENNTDFRFTSELQGKTMSFDDIVKIPFFRFTIRGSYHGNRPALFYKYNYVSKKRDNTRKNFFDVINNMRHNPNEIAACFSYITPQEEYFLYAFLKNYKPESFKGNHYITDTGMYYDNSGNKKVVNYGQHTEKNVCDEWCDNNTNTLNSFSLIVNKLSEYNKNNKNKKDNIIQVYNNNISDLVSEKNKEIYENIFAFIKSGGSDEITYFSSKNKLIIDSSDISGDDKKSLNEKDDRICAVMPPRTVTVKNQKKECYLVHCGKITAKRYTSGNLALDKFKPIDIADFLLVYKMKDKLNIIPISCKMYNKKISLINLTNTEGILNIVSYVNNSEKKDNKNMFGDIILDPDNNEIIDKKEITGKDVQQDIKLGNTLKKYKKNSMFRKILDILRPIKRYKETDNAQHDLQDDFNGLKDKQANDEDKVIDKDKNKELVYKAIKTNQNKKHKDKTADGHAKDNLHYITRAVDIPLNDKDNDKNNIKNLSNFLNDILKFSFGKNYVLCDFTSDGIIVDEDSIRVIDGDMSFTNTNVKNIKFSKLNTQDGNERWSALLHIDFSVEYKESKEVEDYSFRIRSSDSNDGANRLSVDKKNVSRKKKTNESYTWNNFYVK